MDEIDGCIFFCFHELTELNKLINSNPLYIRAPLNFTTIIILLILITLLLLKLLTRSFLIVLAYYYALLIVVSIRKWSLRFPVCFGDGVCFDISSVLVLFIRTNRYAVWFIDWDALHRHAFLRVECECFPGPF